MKIDKKTLKSISTKEATKDDFVVPEGIEIIEKYAFSNSYCKNITLPSTLKFIKYAAFESTKINSINFPNSLKEIEDYAFCYVKFSKDYLFLPEGLKKIGMHAFLQTNLKDIYLPHSIEYVNPTIIANKNLTVHIYSDVLEKLDVILQTADKVKIITLDDLLKQMTFKEINDLNRLQHINIDNIYDI